MAYNMTDLQAVDSVLKLFEYANDSSGGVMIGLFLIGFFFIMFLTLKSWEFDRALLSSSFISFVIGMVLSYSGFLNIWFPLGFLVITGFTALYMHLNR